MGEKIFKYFQGFVKGYMAQLKKNKGPESQIILTKTIDELVLGGYDPDVFVKLSKLSKSSNIPMPENFSIILEVSYKTIIYKTFTTTSCHFLISLFSFYFICSEITLLSQVIGPSKQVSTILLNWLLWSVGKIALKIQFGNKILLVVN